MKLTPEHELSAEVRRPTAAEWTELNAALTAIGQLLAEQTVILEEISSQPHPWATRDQMTELLREVKEVRQLMETAKERKRLRVSLPALRLPRPSLEWLLIPAVLLGLLALWYGWTALWNGIEVFV